MASVYRPHETEIAERWLYGVLSGDPNLGAIVSDRVYADHAPEGAPTPLIIYAYEYATDVEYLGGVRCQTNLTYLVTGVDQGGSSERVSMLASYLDAVLQAASGSIVGGIVGGCTRSRPFSRTLVEEGVEYRQRGGEYLITAWQEPQE